MQPPVTPCTVVGLEEGRAEGGPGAGGPQVSPTPGGQRTKCQLWLPTLFDTPVIRHSSYSLMQTHQDGWFSATEAIKMLFVFYGARSLGPFAGEVMSENSWGPVGLSPFILFMSKVFPALPCGEATKPGAR